MRNAIWDWVRSGFDDGRVLPTWAICIRATLFPVEFFYWRMSKSAGYQWQTDTWLIHGVRYASSALVNLAKAEGQTFKITRVGEVVCIEKIQNTG